MLESGELFSKATFGGGCFWCMGYPFEIQDGVFKVIAGYMGGETENPTYEEVYTDETGHVEVVQISYDPRKITYEGLLDIYWKQVDPTDDGGQFIDRGCRYRPVIFYHNEEQRKLAEKSKQEIADSGKYDKPIVVAIEKVSAFWIAEEYHQRYHATHPEEYKKEREESGRDSYIEGIWGKTCPPGNGK